MIARFLMLVFCVGFVKLYAQKKQIAITVDDLPFVNEISLQNSVENTQKFTQTLKKNHISAIGFVNESALYRKWGEVDERIDLLNTWLLNGHSLGNHTYSHPSFNTTSLEDYKIDFLKGENVTSKLTKTHGSVLRYFRHPFLQTGSDSLKKYGFNQFLAQRGYQIAPVTIDNEDYIFNKVYRDAYLKGNQAQMKRAVEAYISYLEALFDYFEKLAFALENRPIKQVLLCHANLINSQHFDKVIAVMQKRNYEFVTLDEALTDPIYQSTETYVGKGGFSWLHRWKLSRNVKFPHHEPSIPDDIKKLYEAK